MTELTADRRVLAARFSFDRPLDDAALHFAFWDGERFSRFTPPAVGAKSRLAAARLHLGL